MTDDECVAYDGELRSRGQCVASEALHPAHTASTVRVRNGKLSITDGPFAETKETLAGFYLVDARDLNDAIQVASRIPAAMAGTSGVVALSYAVVTCQTQTSGKCPLRESAQDQMDTRASSQNWLVKDK